MGANTFSFFTNVFGLIVAAISLSAFIIKICRSHLPSNKIKDLESLMDQTETFFNKAVEEGLLTEPAYIQDTKRHLSMLRTEMSGLQSRAYGATTLRQDYLEFLKGTSASIRGTCRSLKKLRGEVITSSDEGRRKLMEEDADAVPLTHFPPSNPSETLAGAQQASNDLSHDLTVQSDSDVRTAETQMDVSTVHTSVTVESGAESGA